MKFEGDIPFLLELAVDFAAGGDGSELKLFAAFALFGVLVVVGGVGLHAEFYFIVDSMRDIGLAVLAAGNDHILFFLLDNLGAFLALAAGEAVALQLLRKLLHLIVEILPNGLPKSLVLINLLIHGLLQVLLPPFGDVQYCDQLLIHIAVDMQQQSPYRLHYYRLVVIVVNL